MTIKSDNWIRRMALERKMIEPFVDEQMRDGVISFGLSSYGYDIRVADYFKVFTNVYNTVVDPKNFDPKSFVDIHADVCVIPPNSFALARTIGLVPSGMGTFEAGVVATYASFGVALEPALAAALLFRGLSFWLPLAPGLWWSGRIVEPAPGLDRAA